MAVLFFYFCLLACCTYALWRGGAAERIGAGIFIAGFILTGVASWRPNFRSIDVGIFTVDTLMMVAFLILATRSTRYWPIWMAALQAVQVAGHFSRLADQAMIPWVYAVAQALWSYPMMALLILATWRHHRRLKAFGTDSSWRPSSTG